MPFKKEIVLVPVAIGDIRVILFDPDPTGQDTAGVSYSVMIKFSDGSAEAREGNLTPQLSQAQINQLSNFMATLRTKAGAEFLP